MNFDKKYNPTYYFENIDGKVYTLEEGRCSFCGGDTRWWDIGLGKYFCSEECREVLNPNAK